MRERECGRFEQVEQPAADRRADDGGGDYRPSRPIGNRVPFTATQGEVKTKTDEVGQ